MLAGDPRSHSSCSTASSPSVMSFASRGMGSCERSYEIYPVDYEI